MLRRTDHRDTYNAMFDLFFPAALGAGTILLDDGDDDVPEGLPPGDIAPRAQLVDMLSDNADLANLDERLAAMIAQIVEPTAATNPAAPVVLVVSGAQRR